MTPAKPYTPAEERDAALGLAWAVADAEVFEVAPVLDVAVAEPDAGEPDPAAEIGEPPAAVEVLTQLELELARTVTMSE
jgi:hypothetical protein